MEGTGVIVELVLGKLDTGEIAEDIVVALIQRRAAPLRRQLRLEGVPTMDQRRLLFPERL